MNTGIRYDLAVRHNGTFNQDFNILDANGVAFNLSGWTGSAPITNRFGSPTGLTGFTVSVTSAVSGILNMFLTASGVAYLPVTRTVYKIELISGSTIIEPQNGYFDIYP